MAPPPPPHMVERLKPKHLQKLARLLSLPPMLPPTSPGWLRSQDALISKLPHKLLKPNALLLRLAMRLPGTPQKAILCKTHKPLHPYLIRDLFLAVIAEVTTRLTTLASAATLPESVRTFVRRLQSINSLWMSTEAYRVGFQVMPDEERYERIEGDCEACILAQIGGSEQMVCDLRSTLLGRLKKLAPTPRLLLLVEAWVDAFGSEKSKEEINARSERTAREVRRCRRKMQVERREARRVVCSTWLKDKDEKKGFRSRRMKTWMTGRTTLGPIPGHGTGNIRAMMPGGRSQVGVDNQVEEKKARLLSGAGSLSRNDDVGDEEELLFKDDSDSEYSDANGRTRESYVVGQYDVPVEDGREEQDNDYEYSYTHGETAERKPARNFSVPEMADEDDDSIWTAESIINYYNNLSSTGMSPAEQRNSIHPALSNRDPSTLGSSHPPRYRDSVIFDPATRTFPRRSGFHQAQRPLARPADGELVPAPLAPSRAYRPAPPTASSDYGGDERSRASTAMSGYLPDVARRGLEEHANDYRVLVGARGEEEIAAPAAASSSADATQRRGITRSDARRGNGEAVPISPRGYRRPSNASSCSTRWTDFYD